MSSFNSWLVIVSLLYNVFLYPSSARPTYPPSGEFLHQVNLFYRLREYRRFSWKASALNTYNKLYLIWFRLRVAYTGESSFTFPATRHFPDIFSLTFFWQPKNYKSYSIVFKHLRKLWKCSCKLYSAVFDVFILKQEISESRDLA